MEAITCIQCDKEFEVSDADREKFASRGFDLPKRCPDCRRKKTRQLPDDRHRRRDKKKHYRDKYDSV